MPAIQSSLSIMCIVLLLSNSILTAGGFEPTGIYAVEDFKPTGIYAEKPKTPPPPSPTEWKGFPAHLEKPKFEGKPDPPKHEATKPKVQHHESYSAYSPWYVNGHATSDSHLINVHHVDPAKLKGLSQDEKNRLHGKMHGERPRHVTAVIRPQVQSGGCPNGHCPVSRRR